MKNKLVNLNDHLFAQLERLSDEDIRGENLKEEVERAKAITGIANNIINNGKLAMQIADATAYREDDTSHANNLVRLLSGEEK